MSKSILYWKWDSSIFEENRLENGINDILERSDFDLLYVSFHHLSLPYDDANLYEKIKKASEMLNEHGKELFLDIDIRNEIDGFIKEYPDSDTGRIRFIEADLDRKGKAQFTCENPRRGRTGRAYTTSSPKTILGAWAFVKTGSCEYDAETLKKVDVKIKAKGKDKTVFTVMPDKDNAFKHVLIAAKYDGCLPDIFSDNIYPYYKKMIDFFKDLKLGGVANDEWGYDLMLNYHEGLFTVKDFPYTSAIESLFQKKYDESIRDNILNFAYYCSETKQASTKMINQYVELMRYKMKENNDWFFNYSKKVFGEETFIGVHTTLWGDPYDCSFDVLHNGLCWWEVKRDYAQTDEFCILPIRMALSRKTSGNVWYNMWYSGNTQQLHTYFNEGWKDARYGGRIHHLGYICPNEPGVYRLENPNGLELVAKMEAEIKKIDNVQKTQPKSNVLVVFGMEEVSNWLSVYKEAKITRGVGNIQDVLYFTDGLFEHYNCDLIPTSEIVNGSAQVKGDTVVYGTETYDAVIFMKPNMIREETLKFFGDYAKNGGKLIVMGGCDTFADGSDATKKFKALTSKATLYSIDELSIGEVVKTMQGWKTETNKVGKFGSVYQDGMIVFTSNGIVPSGNHLSINERYKGHSIEFSGDDFLVLQYNKKADTLEFVVAGNKAVTKIDGKEVK